MSRYSTREVIDEEESVAIMENFGDMPMYALVDAEDPDVKVYTYAGEEVLKRIADALNRIGATGEVQTHGSEGPDDEPELIVRS